MARVGARVSLKKKKKIEISRIKDASFCNPLKCKMHTQARNYVPYGVAANDGSSFDRGAMWHNPHAVHRERAKIAGDSKMQQARPGRIAACASSVLTIAIAGCRGLERERVVAEAKRKPLAMRTGRMRAPASVSTRYSPAKRASPACTREKI